MGKARVPKAILWAGPYCWWPRHHRHVHRCRDQLRQNPLWLLQNVASSLVGPASYNGGLVTATLGLLMHFIVAFTVTTIFYLLSRRFPILRRWTVPSGLVYGAVVFLVMYRITIPLTIQLKSLYVTVPFNHNWPKLRWSQLFVHFICIGLPIALVVRRLAPLPDGGARR